MVCICILVGPTNLLGLHVVIDVVFDHCAAHVQCSSVIKIFPIHGQKEEDRSHDERTERSDHAHAEIDGTQIANHSLVLPAGFVRLRLWTGSWQPEHTSGADVTLLEF
eukprot:SAG11_NODE_843_length_6892_cov_31.379803_1_plen_108_part_00